jgi:ribosome-associated protein
MNTIQINREPVELYRILKFEGLASSGGEAKMLIDQGEVKVNGAVELQRRKKIRGGDRVTLGEAEFLIEFDPAS